MQFQELRSALFGNFAEGSAGHCYWLNLSCLTEGTYDAQKVVLVQCYSFTAVQGTGTEESTVINSEGTYSNTTSLLTALNGWRAAQEMPSNYSVWSADALLNNGYPQFTPDAPAAPDASVVTLNYAAETISYNAAYEVYSATSGGTAIATGGSITSYIPANGSADGAISVRVKANGGIPASDWTSIAVEARPATPASTVVTIDYDTETITYAGTYEVNSAQTAGDAIATGGSITSYIPAHDSGAGAVYVRTKAADSGSFASTWQSVTVPERPAIPAQPEVDSKTDVSVTLTLVAGQEYSRDAGAWQDSNVFGSLTAGTGYSFTTGVKAVADTSFASATSAALDVTTKTSPAGSPSAPALSSTTDTTIVINTVAGQEYSINGGTTWQTSGNFAGLTGGAEYSIVTRVAETATAMPSATSVTLYVHTKAAPETAPLLPTITARTDTSITISGSAGNEYQITTTAVEPAIWDYKVIIDASVNFTGLAPATKYYIWARTSETENAMPSEADNMVAYTSSSAAKAEVTTIAASGIFSTGATLNGTVNANNTDTTVTFEYGLTTAYGTTVTAAQSPVTGLSDTAVSFALTGLLPNTTYHCRVVGENSAGTSNGEDMTFKTKVKPNDTVSSGITAEVLIDGQPQTAGKLYHATDDDGRTVASVIIDATKMDSIIEESGNGATVVIPITGGSDVASAVLTGQTVKDMENKDAILEIQTQTASYTLPASEIDIDAIAEQLGADIDLSDVEVTITISEPDDSLVKIVENAAADGGFSIVVQALDFTVRCRYQGNTVEVEYFEAYVQRAIKIPDSVDPEIITTAVVVNADGSVRHVPTKITMVDGVYYAIINSLTNSVYALINNPESFDDVNANWAKDAIYDMASRMILTGYTDGTFNPDANITRAEFAAIVVRALGLEEGMGTNAFSDISDTAWYCGYIETAAAYQIITGYEDRTFRPNDKITREQAMVMVARAMVITGLDAALSGTDAEKILSNFTDAFETSNYAKTAAAVCINTGVINGRNSGTQLSPKNFVSRAEVAVMIQRLLQYSALI